ncbi:MaoC family dehydratase N-terminal domain-containing protein [Dactylosporangium roseum]|uniref:MaoC family dehydratase N-terminal domain-containing protein n=1 Tax=Dactylosporangium roseum TaxID=47989 RepID=A0ABY5ZBR3_9ACTN|nr:MaoC family dehydratase N-terminal domain-containing protein [Dactylosporangium roseum]UWZ39031.1 MaoC family dehydratase N-terminal domain-containing protein [Dactylosporangium roseum]
MTASDADFRARLDALIGLTDPPRRAKDPITEAAIRIWCDAVGDENPAYQDAQWAAHSAWGGIVAPATSLNMWTLPGNRRSHRHAESLDRVNEVLAERGFTSVAAVQTEHTYVRPLRVGDHLEQFPSIGAVSPEKSTRLGLGHFVDLVSEYRTVEGEPVGRVVLRMLRWNPATRTEVPATPGDRLARPVRPVAATPTDLPPAGTTGTLTAHLQPGYAVAPLDERPYLVGTAELADGTRLSADVVGLRPDLVHDGMPVVVAHRRTRDGQVLPVLTAPRPERRTSTRAGTEVSTEQRLAPWPIPVTQLSIAALATATFDFNDVHLDRDAAHDRGARDVYMNILGSSALVNCYLTDWAGPEARVVDFRTRLAAQNHPGDTLTLDGVVTGLRQAPEAVGGTHVTVDVRGTNSLGDHVIASATLALP